jgi:hypothetical protein
MSGFELVISKSERLPTEKVLVSMCVGGDPGRLRDIRWVRYAIGGTQKVLTKSADTQFIADMEIGDREGAMVESEIELASGERWQCATALRGSRLTQAFTRAAAASSLPKPPETASYAPRLQHLEENINKSFALLQACEQALLATRDPLEIAKYRGDIERLHASIRDWQMEHANLSTAMPENQLHRVNAVGMKLDTMNFRLTQLSENVMAVQNGMLQLKEMILAQFEAAKQAILAPLLERVPEGDLRYIRAALEKTARREIPEDRSREIVELVRAALGELRSDAGHIPDLPVAEVGKFSDAVNDPALGLEHKLELSIPIIPFILTYKGTAKTTSDVNLAKAWEWVKARFPGRKEL